MSGFGRLPVGCLGFSRLGGAFCTDFARGPMPPNDLETYVQVAVGDLGPSRGVCMLAERLPQK